MYSTSQAEGGSVQLPPCSLISHRRSSLLQRYETQQSAESGWHPVPDAARVGHAGQSVVVVVVVVVVGAVVVGHTVVVVVVVVAAGVVVVGVQLVWVSWPGHPLPLGVGHGQSTVHGSVNCTHAPLPSDHFQLHEPHMHGGQVVVVGGLVVVVVVVAGASGTHGRRWMVPLGPLAPSKLSGQSQEPVQLFS